MCSYLSCICLSTRWQNNKENTNCGLDLRLFLWSLFQTHKQLRTWSVDVYACMCVCNLTVSAGRRKHHVCSCRFTWARASDGDLRHVTSSFCSLSGGNTFSCGPAPDRVPAEDPSAPQHHVNTHAGFVSDQHTVIYSPPAKSRIRRRGFVSRPLWADLISLLGFSLGSGSGHIQRDIPAHRTCRIVNVEQVWR